MSNEVTTNAQDVKANGQDLTPFKGRLVRHADVPSLCLYVIYDSKAEVYGQPASSKNDETLRREARALVNDSNTPYFAHPEDYTIFRVASFNSDTGCIDAHEAPVHVVSMHLLKEND